MTICHPSRRRVLGAVPALLLAGAVGSARATDDVSVKVERRGDLVVMDVEARVDATVDEVWSVLTDYDRMVGFITSLKTSKVTSRQGDSLEVAQSGETRVMFLRFAFTGVRGIELVPRQEIRSRLIQGDFKSFASTTRLVESGGQVLIVHHGEYVPKAWLPPLIGPAVIEGETRRHYREVLDEVRRRKGSAVAR